MGKITTLTEQTMQRIQRAVRWVEDNGSNYKSYRRIRAVQGGGMSIIWAQVMQGLQYASPIGTPPEGYGEYILRLESENTKTVGKSVDPENGYEEIKPKHLDKWIANTGWSVVDWRLYMPWYAVGTILPIIQKKNIITDEIEYFFWQQMIKVKVESEADSSGKQSIMWNQNTDQWRAMAIYTAEEE